MNAELPGSSSSFSDVWNWRARTTGRKWRGRSARLDSRTQLVLSADCIRRFTFAYIATTNISAFTPISAVMGRISNKSIWNRDLKSFFWCDFDFKSFFCAMMLILIVNQITEDFPYHWTSVWKQSIAMSGCLSVHKHSSETIRPNFTKFFVHVACGSVTVACPTLLQQVKSSSFVNNVIFSYNQHYGGMTLLQKPWCNVVHGLSPLLYGIGCIPS